MENTAYNIAIGLLVICAIALIGLVIAFAKVYLDTRVDHNNYVGEVRVHENSYSHVVHRERHSTPEAARRAARLRANELRATKGEDLRQDSHIVVDVYKASPADKTLPAVWPTAHAIT